MIPVYIPSKGGPDFATAKQLNKVERPFTVFVEPQDFKAYSDAGHVSIFKLPHAIRRRSYQCVPAMLSKRRHRFPATWQRRPLA